MNLINIQLRDCLSFFFFFFFFENIIIEPIKSTVSSSTLTDPVIISDVCTVLDTGTIDVDEYISYHKATYVSIQINIKLWNSYYMYREV